MGTDTDKLVSIKGLVIRATPVIPDMKLGGSASRPNGSPSLLELNP